MEELDELKQIIVDSYTAKLPILNLDTPVELLNKIAKKLSIPLATEVNAVACGDWISVKDMLPDEDKLCNICHYNDHIELAYRRKGNWYVQSNLFSEKDELISKEGQPDSWQYISKPSG